MTCEFASVVSYLLFTSHTFLPKNCKYVTKSLYRWLLLEHSLSHTHTFKHTHTTLSLPLKHTQMSFLHKNFFSWTCLSTLSMSNYSIHVTNSFFLCLITFRLDSLLLLLAKRDWSKPFAWIIFHLFFLIPLVQKNCQVEIILDFFQNYINSIPKFILMTLYDHIWATFVVICKS